MTKKEYQTEYLSLAHAIQSGITMLANFDVSLQAPKHLRVGLNLALCDIGSLYGLLLAKGIITEEEMHKAIIEGMQREVTSYETQLKQHGFNNVTLV
jgi:hypothetical protein